MECCQTVWCIPFRSILPSPYQASVDVGGKLLTNHLKELVSYRQWNMMDETFIVNDVKEKCCFVSQDLKRDLGICAPFVIWYKSGSLFWAIGRTDIRRNSIVQDYILPDLSRNQKGRVRAPDETRSEADQVLVMNNERFVVPEILFRPDDIGKFCSVSQVCSDLAQGLQQMGLASTVAYVISLLPEDLHEMSWANIGLIGGNTKLPGFRARLSVLRLRFLNEIILIMSRSGYRSYNL